MSILKIDQTKRFTKNFSTLMESFLENSPQFTLDILEKFDQILATIDRFPEIGAPRARQWYGKNVVLRDMELFVGHRQFTVRYFYNKQMNRIVLVHLWIDGQSHN